MSNKFDIGDKAIIIGTLGTKHAYLIGEIVTIISTLTLMRNANSGRLAHVYLVDLPPCSKGNKAAFEPRHLKPYYDGNEKSKWDDSIFEPQELVRCLSE